MSENHTIRRLRAGKNIDELKLPSCAIREIKNDIEFSDLSEQLLGKRTKFITNKLSQKLTENKNTKTETLAKVLEPKIFSELILTENKIFISDKVNLSNIEIFNISSDSESKTETEKPILAILPGSVGNFLF